MGRMGLGMRRLGAALAVALVAAVLGACAVVVRRARRGRTLYLVTLAGPGTAGYAGPLPTWIQRAGAARPAGRRARGGRRPDPSTGGRPRSTASPPSSPPTRPRRWAAMPAVALVEQNRSAPLDRRSPGAGAGLGRPQPARGGAGVVVGARRHRHLAREPAVRRRSPASGRAAARLPWRVRRRAAAGTPTTATASWSAPAGSWTASARTPCAAPSALSPLDDSGHGTQMASIAAGNAGVSVQVPGQRLGPYGGVAPQARIAVYKACWTAPDPADDGCATADLVTAIDRATERRRRRAEPLRRRSVDRRHRRARAARRRRGRTSSWSAAAGNGGRAKYAAHPSPWVTSVGGDHRRRWSAGSRSRTAYGSSGAMASARGSARPGWCSVRTYRPPGATPAAARICRPGSLDAVAHRGRIVLCERGGDRPGRRSRRPSHQADGVGMVLVNVQRGRVESDLHAVPTVHLAQPAGGTLRRWHARHPDARVSLAPAACARPRRR